MNASNWTVIAIAFLIGGGIFLALHSLRGRLPRARDVEDTHKPPHRYDAALQALNVLGIDPDARDDDGGTPMHRAAGEGRVEIIELLYAAGANPNARDNRGRTPLHRAASDGKVTKVEALVAAGADINARDNDGATPLHHATAYNGSYEEGVCDHAAVAEALLAAGADPYAGDNNGSTPLHSVGVHAHPFGHIAVIRAFRAAGADLNVGDSEGLTPLHIAARMDHTPAVRALLTVGADINARDRCRRCRSVIAENARKRGQAWSVCTSCARAIEDDTRQLEIAPVLLRRCLVCRTDIGHLRAGARTCADACRNVLSRLLRSRCRPVL